MVLERLFGGDFQSYFDTFFERQPLWLFVHVPKTAGSSLNGELVPILSPSHHIFVDYTALDQRPFHEMLDESVSRFIELAGTRRYAYCTGHITADHVSRIARSVPDVRPMTLLRDPVARFVSDYRYQCSPMHPGHEDFRRAHPTIESYLELPGEWNKASGHLLPAELRLEGDTKPCVNYLTARYDLIGIQEDYALTLRLISTLAGAPRRPTVRKRINTPTAETGVTLSAETEARIRSRNALDIAVYEVMAARFAGVRASLVKYLDRVGPLE